MPTIILAIPQELIRAGLKYYVHDVFCDARRKMVIKEVANLKEAISNAEINNVELVIWDARLSDGSQVNTIKALRRKNKSIPVLIYSDFDNDLVGCLFLQAGANGYIRHDDPYTTVKAAIYQVHAGGNYFGRRVERYIDVNHPNSHKIKNPLNDLSKRETEIAYLMADGHGSKSIREMLNIKPSTLSSLKERIYHKLSVKNAEAFSAIHAEFQDIADTIARRPA